MKTDRRYLFKIKYSNFYELYFKSEVYFTPLISASHQGLCAKEMTHSTPVSSEEDSAQTCLSQEIFSQGMGKMPNIKKVSLVGC